MRCILISHCLNIYRERYLRSCRASAGGEVAAAGLAASRDLGVLKGDVGATAVAAEDVVVVGVASGSSSHIDEVNARNLDSVGGRASRATVKVVLLDINAIGVDIGEGDVLVCDVADLASGVGVGLDTATVGALDDLGVGKDNTVNGVVALAADGADAEAVTSVAVEVVDSDLGSTGDGDAVVLVVDLDVLEQDVIAGRDVEAVTVVGGGLAAALGVGRVTGRVVEDKA